MTDTDWDLVIDTHLKGTFLCAQAAQRVMVPARRGKMVFLSSNSALGNRGQVNYSAAKAGIQAMARTLAIELGPFNINVNAVAPGFIETRMTQAVAERTGIDYADLKKAAAERTPLRRIGRPEDIAGVVSFLCSDDASFVTGQTIYATGGPYPGRVCHEHRGRQSRCHHPPRTGSRSGHRWRRGVQRHPVRRATVRPEPISTATTSAAVGRR